MTDTLTAIPPAGERKGSRWSPGRTFTALRYPGYRYLWLGTLLTSAGVWMEQLALGWLVYTMTDSPFMTGAIIGVRALPFLFFGPLGGVVADRVEPKKLIMVTQLGVSLLYGVLALILFLGAAEVWHLFAFTIAVSITWSFNQPVRQTLMPLLVPREGLTNAIALQSVGFNFTQLIGPAVGGLMLAGFGGGQMGGAVTFGSVAVVWLFVLWTTKLIPIPPEAVPQRKSSNLTHDLLEGIRYVRRDPVVRSLIITALVPMIFGLSYTGLMPVFARDVFGRDATGLGQLTIATGLGSFASGLLLASMGSMGRKGVLLLGAGAALGLTLVGFSFARDYNLALALMVCVGLFSMAFLVLNNTTIQLATPQQFRGRVMSIYMLNRGLMPIGSFALGALAEVFGAPSALALAGGTCVLLLALAGFLMPPVRRLD